MAINSRRIVLGGLAAGGVRVAGEVLVRTLVLKDSMEQQLNRVNPALAAQATSPSAMGQGLTIHFLMGIATVFVYAVMRPRFGAGVGTALRAGITTWTIAGLAYSSSAVIGVFTWEFMAARIFSSLVPAVAAACVGGFLYREAE